jgi:hypothetical protein
MSSSMASSKLRSLAGHGDDLAGVDHADLDLLSGDHDGAALGDAAASTGEVEGTMALFRGAYSVLRNPASHREVEFDDVTGASEAVMLASLLMRMLDRIEARLAPNAPMA